MYAAHGFTEPGYRALDGTLIRIPHRLPAHGIQMYSAIGSVAVIVMPACAIDDPTFAGWTCRNGVYRIEDPSGSVARIGEGRIADRIRYHRAHPPLIPARLVCAFGLLGDWGRTERQFLEEALSIAWAAEGNSLVSRSFRRAFPDLDHHSRTQLEATCYRIGLLCRLADQVLDGNLSEVAAIRTEEPVRWPHPPLEVDHSLSPVGSARSSIVELPHRLALTFTNFPPGTTLRYVDGKAVALAVVEPDRVVLLVGSTVLATVSPRTNQKFARRHRAFLHATLAVIQGTVATTRAPVAVQSPAFLLRMVTGNRSHAGSRWQPTR